MALTNPDRIAKICHMDSSGVQCEKAKLEADLAAAQAREAMLVEALSAFTPFDNRGEGDWYDDYALVLQNAQKTLSITTPAAESFIHKVRALALRDAANSPPVFDCYWKNSHTALVSEWLHARADAEEKGEE